MRRLRYGGKSPKVHGWIGAAIGAATGIVSSIMNKNAQKRQAEAEARERHHQEVLTRMIQENQQLALTQNAQNAYEEQFKMQLKNGGRKRLRSAVGIKEGGIAIPEGDNTFLLRGRKETANNGIIINTNKGEAIVGDGERIERKPNELRVYSDTLRVPRGHRLAGMTFSEAVGAGGNKEELFNIQQQMNGNNGEKGKRKALTGASYSLYNKYYKPWLDKNNLNYELTTPDFKNEGKSFITLDNPTLDTNFNSQKSNAPQIKDTKHNSNIGADFGTADYIGLGVNVLGSVLSSSIQKSGLNSLKQYAPSRPLPLQAGKLVTNYNINPQLSVLERQRQQAYTNIDKDTVSSAAAIAKKNKINADTTLQQSNLYNTKYAKEAEMLNQDTLNQQNVANKNIEAYNKWRNDYSNYMASIAGAKSDSNVAMIQGIGSSIGNFLQQGIDRRQMNLNRGAYLATADKGNPQILNSYGLLNRREQRMQLRNAINSGDKEGINYWSNYVSPRWRLKYGLS